MAAACTRDVVPDPSFDPLFPTVTGELMTMSSPALADLDGDGALDIVFGAGMDRLRPERGRYVFAAEPATPGWITAVSGATGTVLWKVPHSGDAFTTPRFADLNGDGVPDVVMGGREGALAAYDGTDGTLLWRTDPRHVAATPVPYNFFTPAPVGDVDDDGVTDFVVAYGGDDTLLPGEARAPGYIAVISGADGAVLASHATPDGAETYSSIVVYQRPDGTDWFIFGTGGETHGGAAYRAPVDALLDGSFDRRVETLVPPGPAKGVIAPATLVDLTGDGEYDIVVNTFDGRTIVIDGASGDVIWQRHDDNEEAYHPPAVVRISRAGRLGLLVSRGIGEFPRYVGTVHRLHDAADGTLLFLHRDPEHPAGAPLAVDITGDGLDELFFFSLRYPTAAGSRIYIHHAPSQSLITHDIDTNSASTPLIADPRGAGTLELIAPSWTIGITAGAPDWRDLSSHLLRFDLAAPTPAFRGWAGYMGTAADGSYAAPGH
jgi:hypothetical protein